MSKVYFISGCAGFIGFHLCLNLLKKNKVIGIDCLNNYYSIKLKKDRLNILKKNKKFIFFKSDLNNPKLYRIIDKKFKKIDTIIHLAAQAGVRYSIHNPLKYIDSNIKAHTNILQFYKKRKDIKKLVYASSSSVYGKNSKPPFSEKLTNFIPLSLYASTKQSIELISEYYANFYKKKIIGLRFFTTYGEYGRPDLAISQITKDILYNGEVTLLNEGKTKRDFTYIDDVISGIIKSFSCNTVRNHEIFNLGSGKTTNLIQLSKMLGKLLNRKFIIKYKKHHPTDMKITFANLTKSKKILGYSPKTSLYNGLRQFVNWYLKYYKFF